MGTMIGDEPSPGPGAPPPRAAATKKSGGMKWVLIGLGIFGAVGAVCCLGIFGGGWYLYGKFKPYIEEGQKLVEKNPVILQQIGANIRSSQLNQARSDIKEDGTGKIVLDLVGDKGRGELTCIFERRSGRLVIVDATLLMSDGRSFELRGTAED